MNKDRALIALGLSSRARIKMEDVTKEMVSKAARARRKEIKAKFDGLEGDRETEKVQFRINDKSQEAVFSLQVNSAEAFLCLGIRIEELTNDLRWMTAR